MSKLRESRKLERDILPRILVCAFNPYRCPFKRIDAMLTHNILRHEESSSREEHQSQKKLSNSNIFTSNFICDIP
uniref:Uncharacterized protein n=1 Tax=Cucumis melo TaxID=3656 RepID=A0A9I9EDI3_CUCME